jgi:membrane peptidoglycan carboxypeptidase
MGIPLPDSAESALSLALGAFEVSPYNMTNAFATFADNGIYKSAVTMLSITDKFGENIATPIQQQRQAVAPDVTQTLTSILSDEKLRMHTFGSLLSFHENVALKTGTSSDFHDAWTLGYSPTTAIGVWAGNSDNTPMFNAADGAYVAAPIWKQVLDASTP